MSHLRLPARVCAARGRACLVTLLLFGLALAVSACGGGGSSSTTSAGTAAGSSGQAAGSPQRGGTLHVATAYEPVSLDPAVGATDAGSQHVQTLVYDRLLEVRPDSSNLVPGLASSWGLSRDRRSAIFHLRNARFSDGTSVTSADVKFSFQRAMNPKVDPQFGGSLAQLIAAITTPDRRTVVLHFSGPTPAVFSYLAFAPLSIINERVFKRLGAKRFAVDPLDGGSGPFKFVRWAHGQSVTLARNPYYWRSGLPYLSAVKFATVPDDNTRMLDVRSGQVDVADDVPYSQISTMSHAAGVKVQVAPVASVYSILVTAKGPLKSAQARQALAYATPTQAIKKIVFNGQVPLANSPIPPLRYNDPTVKPYGLDIAKAKQLLGQAGLPHGFKLSLLTQAGDAVTRQTATILQNAWSQIGVRLSIRSVDPATAASQFGAGNFQALVLPPTALSSDIPSEDEFAINFTTPAFERSIFSFYDPKLHALIKQIEGTWDEKLRRTLFAQFQREQLANPVDIPMTVATARLALRDNVNGFGYVNMNWYYLDQTWLKR